MEFVKPMLKWKSQWIPFTTLTWSGTDTQASRTLEFEIPWNPYDEKFKKYNIKKGDVVELWFDGSKHAWFVGTITAREKTDAIGTASFTAKDFMHHLLQSTGTYKFKNTTPEAIVKKVCGDAAIPVDKDALFKTGVRIKKMIFEGQCLYDIIIKAYRKVKAETGKNYIPLMLGKKVAVYEKGNPCGATLQQGMDITSATYSDNLDSMVDLVRIYNDKHKEIGIVKNDKHLASYGIYQQTYQKESGISATKAAKAMLHGTNREASIEALGDIRCMSGFSVKIKDPATGLEGKFYITSDSHTFTNDTHTMSLDLAWNDSMETGAETWKKPKETETSPSPSTTGGGGGGTGGGNYNIPNPSDTDIETNNSQAYYIDAKTGSGYMGQVVYAQTCYHSTSGCKYMKKEMKKYGVSAFFSKKVSEIKKMRRIIKAPQTYGKAFKKCPYCWKAGNAASSAPTQGSAPSANQGYTASNTNAINVRTDPRYAHGYIYNHLNPLEW